MACEDLRMASHRAIIVMSGQKKVPTFSNFPQGFMEMEGYSQNTKKYNFAPRGNLDASFKWSNLYVRVPLFFFQPESPKRSKLSLIAYTRLLAREEQTLQAREQRGSSCCYNQPGASGSMSIMWQSSACKNKGKSLIIFGYMGMHLHIFLLKRILLSRHWGWLGQFMGLGALHLCIDIPVIHVSRSHVQRIYSTHSSIFEEHGSNSKKQVNACCPGYCRTDMPLGVKSY